jgi:RND family efflux transporter MFP subunit
MRSLRVLSSGLVSVALLASIAAAGAWVLRRSITRRGEREAAAQDQVIATTSSEKGDYDVVVVCSGRLAAVNSMPAIAEVTGQLVSLAPNGSEVKAGDVVAVLDIPRMERRVRDQQRQYQESLDSFESRRRELRVNVEQARIRLERARRDLEQFSAQRSSELADKRSARERDAAALALAKERYARQKALADKQLISGREVELADARIKAQQFALERETKDLELAEAKAAADEATKQTAVREAEAELERAMSQQQDELGGALGGDSDRLTAAPARGPRGGGSPGGSGRTSLAQGEGRGGRSAREGDVSSGEEAGQRRAGGGPGGQSEVASRESAAGPRGGRGPAQAGEAPSGERAAPPRRGGGRGREGKTSAADAGAGGQRAGGRTAGAEGAGLRPLGVAAEGTWEVTQPSIGSRVMELQMRQAQLSRVEEDLTKSRIVAPADGVIVFEQDTRGGRGMRQRELQPGDRVWGGRPIATIADLSQMRVDIELDPEQARHVKTKQRAIVTVPALPGMSFPGEVTEVSQTASESTVAGTGMPSGKRTFQARVAIKELKQAKLRPGMMAQVRVIIETVEDAISVPLECVFDRDDRHVVYIKERDGFREVAVELGPQNSDTVVITKGLAGGEELALRDVSHASPPTAAPAGGSPRPSASPVEVGT